MVRLYRFEDRGELETIWKSQGLADDVHLPIPGVDPNVAVATVLEEDGRVQCIIIGKLTVEASLVIRPETPEALRRVKELMRFTEGVLAHLNVQLQRCGFGGVTDAEAYITDKLPIMQRVMGALGFRSEPEGFKRFWKLLGS